MENDGIFAAKADLDEGLKSNKLSSRYGEAALTAAEGGLEGHRLDTSREEEAPLLGEQGAGGKDDEDEDIPWTGSADFEGLPWWKRPSLYWLLGPWLIVTLAFGGIIVPKLELILQLVCKQHLTEMANKDPNFSYIPIVLGGDDNDQCRTPEVQALVAQFTLYCSLVGGLLAAVISPKLGALSDRYGRKKLMLITNLGMISGEVVTILCAKYPETFPVQWIIVSYAIDGLCGSFIAAMALANSYATDCTPPAQRSSGFALFHGCLFTGVAVGPIIAGVITEKTGTVLTVFYIMVAAHSSFVLLLMFVIPESLSKARQQAAREKYRQEQAELGPAADWINQIRGFNLFAPLKILLPTGRGTSATLRRNMFFLAATDTTMFGVAMGSMTVVIIYTNYQFGWKTPESARYMSIVNTCRVTCLVVILPLITRLVRGPRGNRQKRHTGADLFDLTVIRFAVLFDTLGYLGYTLARDGTLFTLSGMLASVGGVGSPMLQSALTKSVPPDRTGQLLGATGLLHALARVVAPTVFNAIYKATVGGFTQTVFVCLTATFGVAFLLSWFVRPHVFLDESAEAADDEDEVADGSREDNLAGEVWTTIVGAAATVFCLNSS